MTATAKVRGLRPRARAVLTAMGRTTSAAAWFDIGCVSATVSGTAAFAPQHLTNDAVNALLCSAGYNLRLILNYLAELLRALFMLLAPALQTAKSA